MVTVSRPVHLGVGPLFGTEYQILISLSDSHLLSCSCKAPSLMRTGLVRVARSPASRKRQQKANQLFSDETVRCHESAGLGRESDDELYE
jgi:hypothetical protein